MTENEIRKMLRELYSSRQYRITRTGQIDAYGQMPNSNVVGWWLFGWVGDSITEERLKYLSGADEE